ncbi:MAG TPA: sugar transferase [Bryobacteraceae bacterium]|nr:sugar transferase [Bryobacteraceae bacterium]
MILERVLAALALLACSPVLLAAALAIVLESGFPIFFRQERAGQHGKIFRLIKLRSMRAGRSGARITASGDARVTRVGVFLRKYKIDELPQLWNILAGDMRFIGPRPELPPFVDGRDPLWRAVLAGKPGITDLATLIYRNEEEILAHCADPESAYRRDILPRKLALSVQYRRTRGLATDLRLLALTVRYSFFPRGFEAGEVQKAFGETK